MSYADLPEANPYSAPRTDLGFDRPDSRTPFVGYAGFWKRFLAMFLDYIIVIIIAVVGGFLTGIVLGIVGMAMSRQGTAQDIAPFVGFVLGVVVTLGYFAGMESSSSQATLGKMALGIKVTDLKGRRISFGRALGRTLGKYVSQLILLIGYIMAAFTEKKQALHDMMAGTLVVNVR